LETAVTHLPALKRQNRRLRLGLFACLGTLILTNAAGFGIVNPSLQTREDESFHAITAAEKDGFVVLVRNDGHVYRIKSSGSAQRVIH
jgi:hypothetical protein